MILRYLLAERLIIYCLLTHRSLIIIPHLFSMPHLNTVKGIQCFFSYVYIVEMKINVGNQRPWHSYACNSDMKDNG